MTKLNEELRAKIKSIELMCHTALVGQPDDDEECRVHLEESLRKIRSALETAKKEVGNDGQGEGGSDVGV